jgi:hypothetical protein
MHIELQASFTEAKYVSIENESVDCIDIWASTGAAWKLFRADSNYMTDSGIWTRAASRFPTLL